MGNTFLTELTETQMEAFEFLTEAEKEALENRMKGMSQQEQIFSVQFIDTDILWDELRTREKEARNFKKAMKDLCR